MQFKEGTVENKAEIVQKLKETFASRRNWIQSENPTVKMVLDKYPRLSDYGGEMVSFLYYGHNSKPNIFVIETMVFF